jgi:amino acid adenylation domain-containing protein
MPASSLTWQTPADVPLDYQGPVDVPFTPPPPGGMRQSVWALLQLVAARNPTALALTDGLTRITYGMLLARALTLARQIAETVPNGAAVAMLLPQSPDAVIGVLAALAGGRPVLLLNADHPAERNATILGDSGVIAVIAWDDASALRLPDGMRCIAGTCGEERAGHWQPRPAEAEAPAVVLYTSGSTGRPKGIVLSQQAIVSRALQNLCAQHLNPADRVIVSSATSSIAGLISSLAVLLSGGALYQAPWPSITRVLSMIRDERITVIMGLPALLGLLLTSDVAPAALASLRMLRTTGDALLRSDIDGWRAALSPTCHVNITYGLTEVAVAQWFVPRDFGTSTAALPAGFPMAGLEFAILGDDGKPAARGEAGELVVRGSTIACGEWQNGHCVAGRMPPDPEDPSQRIFHTGDIVRLLPDGMLHFVARSDRQVQIRGQRVEPAEIEEVLRRASGVADAAVVPRIDGDETTLLAFVVCTGENLTAALRNRLHQHLPSFMWPAAIHQVASLPRLPGGKVDQRALLALATDLTA